MPGAQCLHELTSHSTSLAIVFTSLVLRYRMDVNKGALYVGTHSPLAPEPVGLVRHERRVPELWYDRGTDLQKKNGVLK